VVPPARYRILATNAWSAATSSTSSFAGTPAGVREVKEKRGERFAIARDVDDESSVASDARPMVVSATPKLLAQVSFDVIASAAAVWSGARAF